MLISTYVYIIIYTVTYGLNTKLERNINTTTENTSAKLAVKKGPIQEGVNTGPLYQTVNNELTKPSLKNGPLKQTVKNELTKSSVTNGPLNQTVNNGLTKTTSENGPNKLAKMTEATKTSVDRTNSQSEPDNHLVEYSSRTTPSLILFWTTFFGDHEFGFGYNRDVFIRAGCRFNNCATTSDRSRLRDATSVIFHIRDISEDDLPTIRFANQTYVFYLLESPQWTIANLSHYRNFFNITMTYRKDSDIKNLYGSVRPRVRKVDGVVSDQSISEIVKGKTKLVAWIVSHCHTASLRENYVNELKKYIPIDIFGKCGPYKCAVSNTSDCSPMIKHYKFHLSFENALCKDYVTEKLFNLLRSRVLPVVFGGVNYTAEAPQHSYINIADFESPRTLADYLLKLDSNDTLYTEYFEWSKEFVAMSPFRSMVDAFCRLCEFFSKPRTHKTVVDIADWWTTQGECVDPKDKPSFIP